MKGKVFMPFVFVAVGVLAILLFTGAAKSQGLAPAVKPQDMSWSAIDKVPVFKNSLSKEGFTLTEGSIKYLDLVKAACEGLLPDTLANNPWPNTYIIMGFGTAEPPLDMFWQLGENEAIVLVGQTPPRAKFFSYQTFMISLPGSNQRMGVPVGDSINIGTINTIGPDKFNQPIVFIITGNAEIEKRVRTAALKAGYPNAIINVEAISPVIGPLGMGNQGSVFAFGHRVAVAENQTDLLNYVQNAPKNFAVFRLTPNDQLADQLAGHPEPVPVLRVRGTGHTEMALYPSLKELRQAILDGYAGMPVKELDTKVWETVTPDNRELIAEKPYVGLQRGIQLIGATRDTNYLGTFPNFRLRDGVDEFVIVYGVNHQTTGKVTYTSFSIYADKDRWFGLQDGTKTSPYYDGSELPGDSARKYLCPDDPNKCGSDVQYLYAWKVARHCNGEAYCMEVKDVFQDIDGNSYTCNLYDFYANPENPPLLGTFDMNNADLFFLWRSYMEPATNVGPDDNELLYDRAIYFGPYFEP
jgi:hypothetical protein